MRKIDIKKELGNQYKASAKKIDLVEVGQHNYLMVDGFGDPNNSQLFQDCITALFSLSYTLKFMVKKGELQIDYGVMPLEGLWWCDNMENFSVQNKEDWKWTLMILQPDFITPELVNEAINTVRKKKDNKELNNVRFGPYEDGLSAQIMHIGPFSEEPPTIEKLHEFIRSQGLKLTGKHREIYLSDMRRTAPEKLKTIIRQPVKKI